jgi:hypothetical protein
VSARILCALFDLADKGDFYQGGGTLVTFARATKESSLQRMYIEKLPRLDYF